MNRIPFKDKTCEQCGTRFNRTIQKSDREEGSADFRKRRFCSRQCFYDFHRGARHAGYKPGGTITVWGYVRSVDPEGSGRRGHLHRIMMEKKLRRRLKSNEHVHHRDGNPLNNDLDNLELIGASAHARIHGAERRANITHCPSGHKYTVENTYIGPNNKRKCRTCHRHRQREYKRRKKECRVL